MMPGYFSVRSDADLPDRVLMIGLDGTTFDVLDPLISEGTTPTIGRLVAEGARGPLETIFPPLTAAAWTSAVTGKNPGKHGILEFFLRKKGTFEEIAVNQRLRDSRALWDLLGDAGLRSIVTNVPCTYPPEPIDGVMISDFLTPCGRRDFVAPEGLLDEIEERFGPYRLHLGGTYRKGAIDSVVDELVDEVEYKSRVNCFLMEREEWSACLTHVWGTDRIQHELWHVFDDSHPRHDSEEGRQYAVRVRDYWRKVDDEIARMVEAAGPGVHTMLVSDHGFGPLHKYCSFNVWLMQQGLLRLKRDAMTTVKRLAFALGLTPELAFKLSRRVPAGKAKAKRGVTADRKKRGLLNEIFLSFNDVDWSRTLVYSKGNYGQLFLNLKGREPYGVISPGAEYERIRDDIVRRLREIRDPRTGGPLLGQVFKREEIFWGPHVEEAPDICFLPDDMRYISIGDMDFTSNRFIVDAFGISGGHRMHGIFVAHGPSVRTDVRANEPRIVDVAPTILHLLGQPIPDDVDGRVLEEILTDDFTRQNPVRSVAASGGHDAADADLTVEESSEIRDRLRELGYLG
jgi:predicted AlkP superfamily phosphohydrolase/phosphomutase